MQKIKEKDVVIFTNGNIFSRIILDDFFKNYKNRILEVVIIKGDYKGRNGIPALIKYFQSTCFQFGLYKIWTLLLIKILNFFNPKMIVSVKQLCLLNNINFIETYKIENGPLYQTISQKQPKYLISVSCPQLIKVKWLNLFSGNGINIHSSILPKYAGLAPYFWVLVNDENITGTTVHYLSKGFDKGNVLSQKQLIITPNISTFELFLQLSVLGSKSIIDGFISMEDKETGNEQNFIDYSYFSAPTSIAYKKLKENGFSLYNFNDFKILKNVLNNLCNHNE